MPDATRRSRNEIRPIKEAIEDELLARPGVAGVDINEKKVGGRPTGELSIVVYVEHKRPPGDVPDDEIIPGEIDGILTDVQEERIELQVAYQAVAEAAPQIDTGKYTPLRGGISMGPCRSIFLEPPDAPAPGNYVFTGTLGAIVRDRGTGARMALTNFHVACVDDGWSAGDTMAQPSLVDGGSCPADRYGALTRAVLSENVDGAVVTIDTGNASECSIEEIGRVAGQAVATVGMAVRKRGRTTELTHGSVDSVDVSVSLDYGDGLGTRTLRRQIRVVPDTAQNARFSNKGDSGSVVVDDGNRVIGLLFAGTTSGSATFLNPIQAALDELGVDLCTQPSIVLTRPVICEPLRTRGIVCTVTRPVACAVVTRRAICEVVTSPSVCELRTVAGCPPRTTQCPPVSLACGIDPVRPPVPDLPIGQGEGGDAVYGRPDADRIDDAFWLGYYAALEAISDAENQSQRES